MKLEYEDKWYPIVSSEAPEHLIKFSELAADVGIGISNPAAQLHIVGDKFEIKCFSRIAEETWEQFYDCYLNGKFVRTFTREEYYRNFLLIPDPENPNDWYKLFVSKPSVLVFDDCNVGIGSATPSIKVDIPTA